MVFLYAASDSSNAFRMFLLLLEFSLGPDPCDPNTNDASSGKSQTISHSSTDPPSGEVSLAPAALPASPAAASTSTAAMPTAVAASAAAVPAAEAHTLLMGLPRSKGGLYFTAGLLTAVVQKSTNLAALFLSFVVIGAGDSVRLGQQTAGSQAMKTWAARMHCLQDSLLLAHQPML